MYHHYLFQVLTTFSVKPVPAKVSAAEPPAAKSAVEAEGNFDAKTSDDDSEEEKPAEDPPIVLCK